MWRSKIVTDAGLGDFVEYRIGEALVHLNELLEQGERFDFFFIDADKVNYPNYLELAIKLANPGAIIAGDNTLMRGKVVDEKQTKASVQAMRTLISGSRQIQAGKHDSTGV